MTEAIEIIAKDREKVRLSLENCRNEEKSMISRLEQKRAEIAIYEESLANLSAAIGKLQ